MSSIDSAPTTKGPFTKFIPRNSKPRGQKVGKRESRLETTPSIQWELSMRQNVTPPVDESRNLGTEVKNRHDGTILKA